MCSRQRTCQKKRSTWQTVWNTNFTWKGSSQFPENSQLFWHGICSALEYGQEIARHIYIYIIYIIHLIYWSKQGLLGFRGKIRVKSKHPHRWRQQHLASMDQLYRPLFMVVYWGLNHLFFGLIGRLVLRWGHDNEIRGMHEVCATSGAHLFPIVLDTTLYRLPKWIGPVQGHLCSVK